MGKFKVGDTVIIIGNDPNINAFHEEKGSLAKILDLYGDESKYDVYTKVLGDEYKTALPLTLKEIRKPTKLIELLYNVHNIKCYNE